MLNTKYLKIAFLLILVFIFSIAVATFIENSNSSVESWEYVYNTIWFEVLSCLLVLVLLLNIIILKMYKKEKISSLILHLSFVFILVGAIVSKHFGFTGDLHVVQKNSSHVMLSKFNYLRIEASKDDKEQTLSQKGLSGFKQKLKLFDKDLEIIDKAKIINAKKEVIVTPGKGKGIISFEVLTKDDRKKYTLSKKDSLILKNVDIYLNREPKDKNKPYFKVVADTKHLLHFISNIDVENNYEKIYEKNKPHEFIPGILYKVSDIELLASKAILEGQISYVSTNDLSDKSVVLVDVKYEGKTKEIVLTEEIKHVSGFIQDFKINDTNFKVKWGRKDIELPFSIYLKNFDILNYPGSKDVFSYESKVKIEDLENKTSFDTLIKINTPLNYVGYTIFQTKYNRHGSTIFNINYNPGKWFFYIGYILLTLGLILNLFNPNSRFRQLLKQTK